MNFWRITYVSIAFAALATVFWVGQQTAHPTGPRPDMPYSANTAGVEDDVANLEAALARIQERLSRIEAKKADPSNGEGRQPVPPAVAAATGPEGSSEKKTAAEQFVLRAQSVGNEPRDEAWAKPEEGRILAAAKVAVPEGTKYTVEGLACRTSVCKMQITHSSPQDQDRFGMEFTNQIHSEDLAGVEFHRLEQRPDGVFPTEVLILRRGYSM